MNTALAQKPVLYVKFDNAGNRYAVPEKEVNAFTYADEAVMNADWGSAEADELMDDFNARFGEYRKD